jgi:CRP-like cAMP-binding protein
MTFTLLDPALSMLESPVPDLVRQRPCHLFKKGDRIPLQPPYLWQVQQGVVKLHMLCVDGQEVLLGLATAPMLFGATLTCLAAYQATAIVEVQLLRFSLTEIEASPQLTRHLLFTASWRLRQTEALLAITGHRRVEDRLLQLLLLLKRQMSHPVPEGHRLNIHLTHEDVANAIGTSRVTVTRLFGKLRQQELLHFESDRRIVLTQEFIRITGERL